nr:hypothetical protein [Tanacetum cinerariifolium]
KCPKCGNLVDGHYCQECALLRKKFKEDLFTYFIGNGILQDSSEPSNNNTNVVNALQEPFVVKQDPGKNSLLRSPQINHHCCYGCGDSLEDIFCHQCTCELCGKGAHYGYNCPPKVLIVPNLEPFDNQTIDELPQTLPSFDPTRYSEEGNSFTYDSKSNLIHDSPNIDSLFDEFAGELTLLKSILLGINEIVCNPEEEIRLTKRLLYDNSSPRPPEEFISENSDTAFESFSPFPIPVEDKFLSNDSLSLPESESFHFDISSSSRPPVKPPDGNSGILNVKVMGGIFEHKVPMPRLMFTQPTLVPNQEKSPGLLSHQGHEAFQPFIECLMMIYGRNTHILDVPFLYFDPH